MVDVIIRSEPMLAESLKAKRVLPVAIEIAGVGELFRKQDAKDVVVERGQGEPADAYTAAGQ